ILPVGLGTRVFYIVLTGLAGHKGT
ncbi:hypothetical protein MTO96_051138, partial [Rhipicephalus appendiculatus]